MLQSVNTVELFFDKKRDPAKKRRGRKKKTIEEIKKFLQKINYKLISDNYKNNKSKLKIQCDKGHEFEMSFNSIYNGRRCPIC